MNTKLATLTQVFETVRAYVRYAQHISSKNQTEKASAMTTKARLFPDTEHAEAQADAVRIEAVRAHRRVQSATGKRAFQQSLLTLIQARLNEIEVNLAEVRNGVAYWDAEADPDTVDGKEAYQHLSRLKNRRRALEAQLKNWKQRQLEVKVL